MRLDQTNYNAVSIELFRNNLYLKIITTAYASDDHPEASLRYASDDQFEASRRLLALPIAVIDIGASLLTDVVRVIQHVSLAIVNVLGLLIQKNFSYSIKDAFISLESAICTTTSLLVKIPTAPIKIALQTFYILKEPKYTTEWK